MIEGPPPRPDLGPNAPPLPVSAVLESRTGLKGRPPARWSAWESLGIFLLGNLLIGQVVVAAIILVVMGVDQVSSGSAGAPELAATLGADIATVAVLVIWLNVRHRRWVQVLGWPARGERLREIGYGLVAGPVVYAFVAFVAALVLSLLLGALSGQDVTTPEQIDAEGLSRAGQILTVLVAVVVAPITEEFLFRGVLFRAIRDRRGFWPGAVISAVVFGLVHFVPGPWQDTVLLQSIMVCTGFALAFVYERRGNLLAPIVTHMAFNAIGVTLILGSS